MLFAEEPGLVLEVQEPDVAQVLGRYRAAGLHCLELGATGDAGPYALVRRGRTVRSGEAVAHLCQPWGAGAQAGHADSWP